MADFLRSYARRFVPLLALPVVIICFMPWPVWIKACSIAFGISATLVEHYVEWVVLPRRQRAKARPETSPSGSAESAPDVGVRRRRTRRERDE